MAHPVQKARAVSCRFNPQPRLSSICLSVLGKMPQSFCSKYLRDYASKLQCALNYVALSDWQLFDFNNTSVLPRQDGC